MPNPEWTDVHHANHYYGHSHILARYCGLDASAHPGCTATCSTGGTSVTGSLRTTSSWRAAEFLWSERTRRRAWSLGRRQVYAVGAPWAYLLAMEPELGTVAEREGTIWYPFHGWEGQHVIGDHDGLIAEIRRTEPGPVTVCLYWQEFRTVPVRRSYERAGFRVICHGYRGGWWRHLDPRFLYRQLAELRQHARVASNRLCSAVLYGTLVGCEPAVYGDPMVLRAEGSDVSAGRNESDASGPELHGVEIDPDVARRIAADELGADHLMSAAELRAVFGWPGTPSQPVSGTDLVAAAR